jgi:hypothetical protein
MESTAPSCSLRHYVQNVLDVGYPVLRCFRRSLRSRERRSISAGGTVTLEVCVDTDLHRLSCLARSGVGSHAMYTLTMASQVRHWPTHMWK